MRAIRLVAVAVYRESVRDRVPLAIAGFGVLLVAASFLISQLTAGQDLKIIKDLGLAAINVLGLFIAIFIGINLVAKEVERRSIYNLLSKPVTREQFLIGKYIGLAMTLVVNIAAMCLAFYGVLWYHDSVALEATRLAWPAPALDPKLMIAVGLIVAELMVVTAIALFFSSFAGPLVAMMLTAALWIAGHFNADLRQFEQVVDSTAVAAVARALYYALPNLAPFNVKAEIVHGIPVAASHVLLTLAYAAVYVTMLLVATAAVFRRRDFK